VLMTGSLLIEGSTGETVSVEAGGIVSIGWIMSPGSWASLLSADSVEGTISIRRLSPALSSMALLHRILVIPLFLSHWQSCHRQMTLPSLAIIISSMSFPSTCLPVRADASSI